MYGRRPLVALIPLRSPGAGKTRLATGLSPEQRAALSGAMLADVVGALRESPVDRIVVAAAGSEAAAAATALGLDVVLDPPSARTLDAALRAAQGHLARAGSLLVVTADLPRLRPRDLTAVLEAEAQVVIAATKDGGTGGLLRTPPSVIDTAYGPHSALRHLRLGHAAGVTSRSLDVPGFRDDIDTWDDLLALRRGYVGPYTATFLDTIAAQVEEAG